MRLSFRTKLMAIAGVAGAAFVVLIVTQKALLGRMNREVIRIQDRFIPMIELGPRLDADFDRLKRGFQDSVAAQDKDALERTRALRMELIKELGSAKDFVEASRVEELRQTIEEYGDAAYDVSHRLIDQETGTALVSIMSGMQSKQARVERMLNESFTPDRAAMVEAFSAIDRSQKASARIMLVISVLCLLIVALLSFVVSRSLLHGLDALSDGMKRFGQGKFGEPIVVSSHDELEELAAEANQMAGRTASLLKELESFSYSVAHDLRTPLRGVLGFGKIVLEDHGKDVPEEALKLIQRVVASAKKMAQLVDSLLSLSRLARTEIKKARVDLSSLVNETFADLQAMHPERKVELWVQGGIHAEGDFSLLQVVFANLLGNAWKFTSKTVNARIQFGMEYRGGVPVFFLRDNGAGFDMRYANKLFGTFQRLHSDEEFEGTGIGLATVQTIIMRHGGEIWAEGKVNEGAAFFFTLGRIVPKGAALPASIETNIKEDNHAG